MIRAEVEVIRYLVAEEALGDFISSKGKINRRTP
jgi:hypothetical protein